MKALAVRGLHKRFGGLQATRNVSFEVAPGEIYGLIGPNGAGKTTVFNLLTGFIPPDGGTVLLGQTCIDGWIPERRAEAGLARTFQIVKPFGNLTVLDNVVMGAMLRARTVAAAREQALQVLERVGMAARPGAMARTLSIGDRKRLELAKALATGPRVLLLDEVMGGLIPAEVKLTLALLRKLAAEGVAVVLIEHNMQAIMTVSDRILVLHHGEPIAEGTPATVSRDPAVLAAYLGQDYRHAAD
jgi:branched-chain amino acid transport system ATP-binding protein